MFKKAINEGDDRIYVAQDRDGIRQIKGLGIY
jgi:hypothetical protein